MMHPFVFLSSGKAALLILNVPTKSISTTADYIIRIIIRILIRIRTTNCFARRRKDWLPVLKPLVLRDSAGQRKFPLMGRE